MAHPAKLFSALIVVVVFGAFLVGCQSSTSPPSASPAAGGATQQPAHGSHTHAKPTDQAATESHDAKEDPLATLLPEDRAAVEKQGVCPVTDEKLGSMGTPYKTSVKGQTVFLCCEGCEEDLKKEPDTFLAKLKK